jgi:hypothetical protein
MTVVIKPPLQAGAGLVKTGSVLSVGQGTNIQVNPNDVAAGAALATDAEVTSAVNALVDAAPGALDTLNELANALGDDPNFATTITNSLATKETPAGAQAKVDLEATARAAADALLVPLPYRALDIWPAFSYDGAAGSWQAVTYAQWIGGIDTVLAPQIALGTVVKTDLGVCSNGVDHLFSYTAGTGPHILLLIAGQHASEWLNQTAAMRWFQQFVQSTHPTMVYLRQQFKVIYVPTVTPSGYRGSTVLNANGVNTYQNWPFYHADYTQANYPALWNTTYDQKGAAPFDQPESVIIRDLFLNNKVVCFIDCHNGGSGNTMHLGTLTPWGRILANRNVSLRAFKDWQNLYPAFNGTLGTATNWGYGGAEHFIAPNPLSWMAWQARYVLGREHFAGVLLESNDDSMGSIHQQLSTQAAHQAYCGYITQWLLAWLQDHTVAVPYPIEWSALRVNSNSSVALAAGGTQIQTSTYDPLTFDFFDAHDAQRPSPRNSMRVLFPYPGSMEIAYDAAVYSTGAQSTYCAAAVFVDGVQVGPSTRAFTTPAVDGFPSTVSGSCRVDRTVLDGATINEISLRFQRISGANLPWIAGTRLRARLTPAYDPWAFPIPALN